MENVFVAVLALLFLAVKGVVFFAFDYAGAPAGDPSRAGRSQLTSRGSIAWFSSSNSGRVASTQPG